MVPIKAAVMFVGGGVVATTANSVLLQVPSPSEVSLGTVMLGILTVLLSAALVMLYKQGRDVSYLTGMVTAMTGDFNTLKTRVSGVESLGQEQQGWIREHTGYIAERWRNQESINTKVLADLSTVKTDTFKLKINHEGGKQ